MSHFTSDTDRIFCLKDLPEVTKGALFARYSRSSMGLRELYEKEFRGEDAAAEGFYERVLDGFGDDSVAELGNAHLALENISILATKVIEDGRIGASYLEKSTRYVDFGEKENGHYRYYVPHLIQDSSMHYDYVDACDLLFETYVDLLPKVKTLLTEQAPDSGNGLDAKGIQARAIKAKAFDLCRGLLPASTLTNMGINGNGRYYEAFLIKMMQHSMMEMQKIGWESRVALAEVIPSFIRKANHNNKHYTSLESHKFHMDVVIASITPSKLEQLPQRVKLLNFDSNAVEKILTALVYECSDVSWEEARRQIRRLPEKEIPFIFEQLVGSRTDRRHRLPRAFEHSDYQFEFVADFGIY